MLFLELKGWVYREICCSSCWKQKISCVSLWFSLCVSFSTQGAIVLQFQLLVAFILLVLFWEKGTGEEPGNCQPINLTLVVGKMLETLRKDEITKHLEKYELIMASQLDFWRVISSDGIICGEIIGSRLDTVQCKKLALDDRVSQKLRISWYSVTVLYFIFERGGVAQKWLIFLSQSRLLVFDCLLLSSILSENFLPEPFCIKSIV